MRRLGFLAITVFVGVACGGTKTSDPESGGDGGAAERDDADAGADAGFTILGGVKCCVEGTGTSCCMDADTPRTCAQYGGPPGHCSRAGEAYATKVSCALCCAGMRPIGVSKPSPDGSCPVTGGDSRVCAPCGDGVCDPTAGENRCSCPDDCE